MLIDVEVAVGRDFRSNPPWRATARACDRGNGCRCGPRTALAVERQRSAICVSVVCRSITPRAHRTSSSAAMHRRVCATTPAVMRMQPAQPGSLRAVAHEDAALDQARRRSARVRSPTSHQHEVGGARPVAQAESSQRVVEQRLRLARPARDTSRSTPCPSSAARSADRGSDVEAVRRHAAPERLRARPASPTSAPTRRPARP